MSLTKLSGHVDLFEDTSVSIKIIFVNVLQQDPVRIILLQHDCRRKLFDKRKQSKASV